MEERQVKALVRQIVGITDEDWEILKKDSPGVYKFFERIEDVGKSRIVAEVIESKYCAAGLKIGQRLVIEGGALVPEKPTAPFCMRAIGPLTGFVNTILEMIVAGWGRSDSGSRWKRSEGFQSSRGIAFWILKTSFQIFSRPRAVSKS